MGLLTPWNNGPVRRRCYPPENTGFRKLAGIVLIVAGALALLFFVPGWAWLAILAALLIVCGILLIPK